MLHSGTSFTASPPYEPAALTSFFVFVLLLLRVIDTVIARIRSRICFKQEIGPSLHKPTALTSVSRSPVFIFSNQNLPPPTESVPSRENRQRIRIVTPFSPVRVLNLSISGIYTQCSPANGALRRLLVKHELVCVSY